MLVIALYEGQSDLSPRWIEYQTVTLDPQGRYDVQFGATREDGLPMDLFTAAPGVRWLGVAIENETEQPRARLVSVPFAAKAAEAETLAGKAATDFVLSSTFREDLRTVLQEEGVTGTSNEIGTEAITLNRLQKGDGTGGTTDSAVFEHGGNVGIGITAPLSNLHVSGVEPFLFLHYTGQPQAGIKGSISFFHNRGIDGALEQLGRIEGIAENAYSNGGFRFVTRANADVEVMRFNSNGNVGIGTDIPGAFRMFVNATGDSVARFRTAGGGGQALDIAQSNGVMQLTASSSVGLGTNGAERLRIDGNGNVGIGVSTPGATLHVNGTAYVSGDVTVNGNIAAKYQDVAEWVDAAETLDSGTVVTIDASRDNRVAASSRSYDRSVAGAVSPQPGLILGEPGPGRVLIAQSGRVRVKVDATYGAIKRGDLLVSSPTKGHAMRSKADKVRPGTVIGKALEQLNSGRGEILVLLTLQ